jgi:hypothetical protein
MLPKEVTDLTDRFVRVFDSERPAMVEFRRAYDEAAAWHVQEGVMLGDGAMSAIEKNVTGYVDDRSRFTWRKLQEAVASTEIEAYPELSSDLKLQLATYCNPVRQAAEHYMEEIRLSAKAPPGNTVEAKGTFADVLTKIHAEVDLFSARYTANRKRETPSTASQVFNIGNGHGMAGHGAPPRVTLTDCSARQLLIDHSIPKNGKLEKLLLAVFSCVLVGIGVYVAYRLRKHS